MEWLHFLPVLFLGALGIIFVEVRLLESFDLRDLGFGNARGRIRDVCEGPQIDYIVTGGAGFIGSTLVKALRTGEGHTVGGKSPRVVVLDNLWRGTLENLKDDFGIPVIDLKMDFVNVDLTDRKATFEAVRCAKVVYHLADIVAGVDFVFGNQGFVFEHNLLINSNVLAACRRNHIAHYIYVGTACSFPKHLQMSYNIAALHENQTYPASPESSYGWSKLMGEYQAQLMLKEPKGVAFRPNITVLRFHNIYGPGMQFGETSQALPALIRKVINYPEYEKFEVWGSGMQYRDFTYVDDVVNALLLARTRAVNYGTVQIGTGVGVTLRESAGMIAAIAKEAFGSEAHPQFTSEKPEGDRGRVAVLERAENVLHWKPKVYIAEGLSRTFAWIAWRMLHSETTQPAVKDKLQKFFERESAKDGTSSDFSMPPTEVLKDRLRRAAEKAYSEVKPGQKSQDATKEKKKDKKRAKLNGRKPPIEDS